MTSFEYQLHPVGPWLAGTVVYPRAQARDILRYHRDFSEACSDRTAVFAGLMTSPDGAPIIALPIGYHGPLDEGERVLAPLRRLGTPLFGDVGPKSYVEVQSIFNPAVFPHGMHRYWKSSFLTHPPDAALDMAMEYAGQMASPHSMILFLPGPWRDHACPCGGNGFRAARGAVESRCHWAVDRPGGGPAAYPVGTGMLAGLRRVRHGSVYMNHLS